MVPVVEGLREVRELIGQPPVIVGGLAVLARLSSPYRATVDLDVVDRLRGLAPQLEVLRSATGARAVEPAAVLLPTRSGMVRVDVLEVRQIELDRPSDDPGDRLHASAHAWAHDTATDITIEVLRLGGEQLEATAPVAEAGPLIAMKLQAVMNRSDDKQGTDLLDIVRLTLDASTRPVALEQITAITEAADTAERGLRAAEATLAATSGALDETERHLVNAARYVYLNPVRAGLCARPEDWPWSGIRG